MKQLVFGTFFFGGDGSVLRAKLCIIHLIEKEATFVFWAGTNVFK